jgi:hypothetical protein
MKSGLELFHEAMAQIISFTWEQSFERVECAAAKGHAESIWILSVVKDVEIKESVLKEAFAKTETPLGWYFAGRLSIVGGREKFDFYQKSAEGGCSWGQVMYAWCFRDGQFVEKDEKVYLDWLEKAANQNNPLGISLLGDWFREEVDDKEKAVSYYRTSAELGWKNSMHWLSKLLRDGEGCAKNLRHAVVWGAKGKTVVFWELLEEARVVFESGATEDTDCDFNHLCYSLGWGMYWHHERGQWKFHRDRNQAFSNRCLDFYCSCIEQQQESIFTFLLCWNRTTGGVKGPGRMIAQMVWEGKETNVLLRFGEKRESWGCILF